MAEPDDKLVEARQLLDDYNFYRNETEHVVQKRREGPFNEVGSQPWRLELLTDMAAWCRENGVPSPRFWLYTLFKARNWRFAPNMSKANLMSEKHLKRLSRYKATRHYEERLRQTEEAKKLEDDTVTDPNLRVDPVVEKLKRRYHRTGRSWACLEGLEQTYGYHPLSEVCSGCFLREQCLANTQRAYPFDIVEARLKGTMPTRVAREAVARG